MTADTPARCEPPEALRGVSGWHEILQGSQRAVMYWMPEDADSDQPYWSAGVLPGSQIFRPKTLARRGWRYLSPVPTLSEIATLVRAGRAIANDPKVVWHADGERLHALSAALDAPSFKEIGDGE